MNSSDPLKAAEEKLDDTLHAYTERNRHDPELHQRLIDDLRTATTEFLKVRGHFSLGLGRPTT
jgi:chemotaxis methyl-accepting protein methylase